MIRVLVALLVAIALPYSAEAGAWMREKKEGFTATSSSIYKDRSTGILRYDSSIYVEYGLFPRFTIGLDSYENFTSSGHIMFFGRVPLTPPDAKHKFAFQLGVGAYHYLQEWQLIYKTTLSYGKSIESSFGTGWLSVDAAIETRKGAPDPLFKLDATFGLNHSEKIKSLYQVETSYSPGRLTTWKIGPAIAVKAGKLGMLIGGLEIRSDPNARLGLKLGIWRDF